MENKKLFSVCNTKEQYREMYLRLAGKIGLSNVDPGSFEINKSGIIILTKPVGDSGFMETSTNNQENINALLRSGYKYISYEDWPCHGVCDACNHRPCEMGD